MRSNPSFLGVDDQMRQEQEEQAEKEKERLKNVVERVRLIVKGIPFFPSLSSIARSEDIHSPPL